MTPKNLITVDTGMMYYAKIGFFVSSPIVEHFIVLVWYAMIAEGVAFA